MKITVRIAMMIDSFLMMIPNDYLKAELIKAFSHQS